MTAEKWGNSSEENITQNHSDFSIEHILNRAGNGANSNSATYKNSQENSVDSYSWLQCTRYCPPKVPKTPKRLSLQKRQLGRHPRIPFSCHQLSVLEKKFQQSPYLSSEQVITLARQLQLADVRVKIWFQNRRARERREKLQNANRIIESVQEEKIASTSVNNSDLSSHAPQVYNLFSTHNVSKNSTLPNYLVLTKHINCTSEDVR